MDRRKFLRAAAAAALTALSPRPVESAEKGLVSLESELTTDQIERHKMRAVQSLTEAIPKHKELQHIREYSKHLGAESEMYVPVQTEISDVTAKSRSELDRLAASMRAGEYGLFVFADRDAEKNNVQRLYVLQRVDVGLRFVKAYRVSTARSGFGNEVGSTKTPLGMHVIPDGKRGALGEIVARAKEFDDKAYVHVRDGTEDRWFVRGFGSVQGDDVAEVITDQYLLTGPKTSPSRGIRIHATNRAGKVGPDGTWVSFLGGRRRSGGCIRMSSTDIRDLYLSGYVSVSGKKRHAQQTKVLLHATPAAIEGSERLTPEDLRDMPPRWKRPTEAETPREEASQEKPAQRTMPANAPPRWRRPEL